MPYNYIKMTGDIDRRNKRGEGELQDPILRENLLARDGVLRKPRGTERALENSLSAEGTWMGRYYTKQQSRISPKTFIYTIDGKLWWINEHLKKVEEVKDGLNLAAFPRAWTYKTNVTSRMFLADGLDLYEYNGNDQKVWGKVPGLVDTDDNPLGCIDVIEHLDRLCVLTPTKLLISANLQPTNFTDALDSLEIVVGSSKGENKGFWRDDNNGILYIMNTEGIYRLYGDVISAVASTFSIRITHDRRIISGRSLFDVEQGCIFLADDLELYSYAGGNTSQRLTHKFKLADSVNPLERYLKAVTATYEDNYYKLSYTPTGGTYNSEEIWWDALENKIDVVKGRNVGGYMKIDETQEPAFQQYVGSSVSTVYWGDRGRNFDGAAIECKLTGRDFTPQKGRNVRFDGFYPEFEPSGEREIFFRYLLNGRLSNLGQGAVPNVLQNSVFNNWTPPGDSGSTADNWTLAGSATPTLTQIVDPAELGIDTYTGRYAARLTAAAGAGNVATLAQHITTTAHNNKQITVTGYVKCSTAGARIDIYQSEVALAQSPEHSGSGEWERLSATSIVPSTATSIGARCIISGASRTAVFDGVTLAVEETKDANWTQDLSGEAKTFTLIRINNQAQATDRVLPDINYARGTSVCFEIYSNEIDSEIGFMGVGLDYHDKGPIKGKLVGA